MRESEENLRYTVELTPHIPVDRGAHRRTDLHEPALGGDHRDARGPRNPEALDLRRAPRTTGCSTLELLAAIGRAGDRRSTATTVMRCVDGVVALAPRSRAYPRRAANGRIRAVVRHDRRHPRPQDGRGCAGRQERKRLEDVTRALDKLAHEDHLTELANRRTFDEKPAARRSNVHAARVVPLSSGAAGCGSLQEVQRRPSAIPPATRCCVSVAQVDRCA